MTPLRSTIGTFAAFAALATAFAALPQTAAAQDRVYALETVAVSGDVAPSTGTFFDEVSDPDGTIQSFVWTQDGSVVGTGAVIQLTLGEGSHSVTLEVTDDDGATSQDAVTVTVKTNKPSKV